MSLFWPGRKRSTSPSGRNWIHQSDNLVNGHVVYMVKFLGSTIVDQPKGIEVVKDAIKKLNFNQQLRAKENAKCKKVEITISVDGVAVQEPRSTNILHQFPLHRISYCADDKGAKKYFSFIAKCAPATNGFTNGDAHEKEQHECFVFISTKLAAEITLTIGQAFDLAYRRFMSDNGKYLEVQKLQLLNKQLELQTAAYKARLADLARLLYKDDLQTYLSRNSLSDVCEFKTPPELANQIADIPFINENGLEMLSPPNSTGTPNSGNLLLDTTPPRIDSSDMIGEFPISKNPVVGTKLKELLLSNSDSDSDFDFDPRGEDPPAPRPPPRALPEAPRDFADVTRPPLLAPPPKASKRQNGSAKPIANGDHAPSDLFGSAPFGQPLSNGFQPSPFSHVQNNRTFTGPNYDVDFKTSSCCVFDQPQSNGLNGLNGLDPFDTRAPSQPTGPPPPFAVNGISDRQTLSLNSNFNGFLDKTISEMKDGFIRGIDFGNDDFNIDQLDPLKKN